MRLLVVLTLFVGGLSLASAAQAPYYLWQGKHKTLCAQTSPGPGWKRISGGYVKADCSL